MMTKLKTKQNKKNTSINQWKDESINNDSGAPTFLTKGIMVALKH